MKLQRTFSIEPVQTDIVTDLQQKIDQKTKPLGALGKLERLALQIGQIQYTLEPMLSNPTVLVFAGDHGIVEEGVSAYPQEVTQQMVLNFLSGGAAVNVFARQHHMDLYVVDAGVNGDLPDHAQFLKYKIAPGTKNFRHEPAMTPEQCEQAISTGADIVQQRHAAGCNVIMFGEMGIGNTTPATALLSVLGNVSPEECTGRGTGLDDAGLVRKKQVLAEAIAYHAITPDPFTALTTFGGFEIAMMCGAFLQAASERMIIVVDGFIVTSALLAASRLYPAVLDYCVFGHLSEEPGHRKMLKILKGDPLLHLDMRLGEGTGAILAYPLLESAVRFLNEMACFASAGVSEKL
jgi:nicotinate-nucleotide--dimethylbenzimidazole phosphoribosyltransferase